MKYKIGDRVRITAEGDKLETEKQALQKVKWLGKAMTVRAIYPISKSYKMSEDKAENCGKGWRWFEDELDGLADEQKIVITTDGKTTTAKLYDGKKFIKEATAKCSPEDTFDFDTGAVLAFSRLMNGRMNDVIDRFDNKITKLKQNRPFSGKAVYIRLGDFFNLTQGKIYNFIDGRYSDNVGEVHPCDYALFEEDLKAHGFLPIVE